MTSGMPSAAWMSAHGSNVARHGDEGLAAQAAAETNVHQVDISRLHGCIGCDNGCAEAVGLHNADGSDLADLVAGVDGAGHLLVHMGDHHAVDQALTGLGLACRDAFADGGDLARDDHDVLARADRLRRDKLDRRGLEHRIAGVDAERDALNFNHTQCIHLAAFLISM